MSQGDHYAYGEPGVNAGSRGCKARGFQCSRSLSNSRLRPKSLDIPCSDSCKDTGLLCLLRAMWSLLHQYTRIFLGGAAVRVEWMELVGL